MKNIITDYGGIKMENMTSQVNVYKKIAKKSFAVIFISLLVSAVVFCLFLMRIGIFRYPNWYLISNFRINKHYFETIISSDEYDGFSSGQEYYIDKIDDPALKTAIKKLFVYGIWGSFRKEYQYEDNYGSSEAGADKKQREVAFCIFQPDNASDYDVREIIYAKDEDVLNSKFFNVNDLYHIEGNWYYFQYYDNDPWDRNG